VTPYRFVIYIRPSFKKKRKKIDLELYAVKSGVVSFLICFLYIRNKGDSVKPNTLYFSAEKYGTMVARNRAGSALSAV